MPQASEKRGDRTPLISIVMCVYDGDELRYLTEAADSILCQTFPDFEFIIVMDGVKRDDIRQYLEGLRKQDARVRLVIIPENSGLGNALNTAISSAAGEFIIRTDADDISYPNRAEKLVEFMNSHEDVDVAGSFIEEFFEESVDRRIVGYPTQHGDIKKIFARRNGIAHASVIFRKRFFDKTGYYPLFSIRNEDTLLFLSGLVNGCKFANIPEVLYSVRYTKRMGSRRIGFRKSFSDFVDRLRIIIDTRASLSNVFYALGMLMVQNLPYSIYSRLRSALVCRKKKTGRVL